MRFPLAFTAVSLSFVVVGCDPPVPENNSCDGAWFVPFLAPETAPTVDVSCAEAALTNAAPFEAACQIDAALAGQTVDHQSSDPVGDISLDVHHGNDLAAAADWSATSDDVGAVSHDVPLCTPISYRTEREADARVTTGQHVIIAPGAKDPAIAFDFRSVGNGTVSLIGTILAVNQLDENGLVFGKAVGCDGDLAVDKLQVLVRDDSCSVPQTFSPGYTNNELPDLFSRATTDDGFYFATNVPPGTWTLEGYITEGDSFRLVASAPITVRAKEVTLVDLQIGRSDGLRLKEGCTSCE